MILLWKNHWPLIIPGLILAAWVIACLIAGDKSGLPLPGFPKWRIRLMGGVTVFFFLAWYNCGMLLWDMGLRLVLLIGFLLSAFLFFRMLLRGRKRVEKGLVPSWHCRVVLNLIPAWFLGVLPAGILQSLWVSGAARTESSLIRLFCGALAAVLIFGFLLLDANASGINWGYDPEEEKKRKKEIRPIDIAIYHAIQEGIRQEKLENERNYRRFYGMDDSDLDDH